MTKSSSGTTKRVSKETRYAQMIERVFFEGYESGAHSVPFVREQLQTVAKRLKIALPKNLGDTLYTFRYRVGLPQSILDCQPPGREWAIFPDGRSKYRFVAVRLSTIAPRRGLPVIKIPDATPGLVELYSKYKDEQALLAKLRYNRLLDIHTGAVGYSLQNHLRTTIDEGQLETDELYVGIDGRGAHYAFPVQAKGGKDLLSVVQVWQDFKMCAKRFPKLIARPVGAQFMDDNVIALFSFKQVGPYEISVVRGGERHYKLVPPGELTDADLTRYAKQPFPPRTR